MLVLRSFTAYHSFWQIKFWATCSQVFKMHLYMYFLSHSTTTNYIKILHSDISLTYNTWYNWLVCGELICRFYWKSKLLSFFVKRKNGVFPIYFNLYEQSWKNTKGTQLSQCLYSNRCCHKLYMSVDRKTTNLIKYLTFDLPVHQFSSTASNSN